MGLLDGISASERTLRIRYSVWGWVWGAVVAAAGFAAISEEIQRVAPLLEKLLDPLGEHRETVGRGLMALGLVMALWRKTTVFHRDGRVTILRHLVILPIQKTIPRSEICAFGTGAETHEFSWWHCGFRYQVGETTTYIGSLMCRDGGFSEVFRCKGHGDFQRRLKMILEFTGLPVRRN